MNSSFYIVFFYLICSSALFGQKPELPLSSLPVPEIPISVPGADTIPGEVSPLLVPEIDIAGGDTTTMDTMRIQIADDAIDREVIYSARDSSDVNNGEKKLYLWGEAKVVYGEYTIEADMIIMDMENDMAIAESREGEEYAGIVKFNDGNEDMQADRLKYNFKTKKGHMTMSRSQQGDLYVISEQLKFISAEDDEYRDDEGYGKDAIFTTCNAKVPHFGIRSRRQKIVPDKVVVVGVSNVEIGQVPTPLILPFGFFPISKGAKKGVIFPNDYEYSEAWGFGLRGIGYYIPINEKMDLTVTGDIFLRGSWGVNLGSRYNFRYKATGSLNLSYSYRTAENLMTGIREPEVSTGIRWSHNQDPKAHPYQTFSATVNFQTNNFQSLNYNDAQSVLQNSINSNISYRRSFPGKPFSLAASLAHSQNTATNQVIVSFPNVDFQMQRIFPFERKNRGGNKPKWYEEISLTYNSKLQNRFTATDTTIWTSQTLDDARFGIQQRAAVNTNFRVLKYISVVPNFNLTETWQFSTVNREFDPTIILDSIGVDRNEETGEEIVLFDTIPGRIIDERVSGFRAWRTYSLGASMNTQIFGTVQFKRGFLKGLRHVMKPSVNFNYSPDYTNPDLNYIRSVRRDVFSMDSVFYSVFEDNIFGGPPRSGRQMAINYSLNNIFEAKYRMRGDTVDRKAKLFDNIIINGNYNFAADSLKFSTINFSGTHRLFKGMTTLQMGMVLDPYERDYSTSPQGRRTNTYAWDAKRRLVNFVSATATINSSLSMRTIRQWVESIGEDDNDDSNTGNERPAQGQGPPPAPNAQELGPQSLWDWFEDFNINHVLMLGVANMGDRDTFMVGTNNIQVTGSIMLTKNWRITLGSIGYDFNRKQLTYPDVGFQRDLHCWEMGMNWQPLRGTYNFYIRVKPGSLDFLKVPYRKNNEDGLNRRL